MDKEERDKILTKYEHVFKNEESYYGKKKVRSTQTFNLEDEQFFRLANIKFRNLIGLLDGKKILDIGCGRGHISFYLAREGANVIGIDLSESLIDHCKQEAEKLKLNLEFKIMNAQIPDFEDQTFDIIIGSRAIHHLPNLDIFFKECKRLLKKKGYIVFIEPLKKNPIVELNRKYFAPKLRTKFEHPLLISDILKAKNIFGNIQHYEYFLISPFAMVIGRVIKNRHLFKTAYKILNILEKPICKIRFFQDYCWQTVFKCTKN
ncbi:MAG: class I SAM-dependent methyltransferase [Candidatus Lokiarchaeota archaeon]|nr:class I SAM-dependent methyltransferase [Candidatus Lokiarchaeota archaeon]